MLHRAGIVTGCLIAAGSFLGTAGSAFAAPDINGTNDQWFTAGPGNHFRVVGAPPGAGYRWQVHTGPAVVRGGLAQAGAAGVAVIPVGALGNGRYVLRATHVGAGGAPIAAALGRRFGIDGVAPRIAVSLAPGSRVEVNSAAVVSFSCADPAPPLPPSGVTSCAGGVGARPVASGGALPSGALGLQVFRARATDAAGNVALAAVPYVVVDTTAPRAPAPLSPSAATGDTTPTFTWSAGIDAGVGGTAIAGYRLEVAGQPPVALPAAALSYTWPKALLKGDYSWRVVAIDIAGNQAPSAPVNLLIDPTPPPPPTLTAGPAGPTNLRDVSFAWQGVAGASFEWRLRRGKKTVDRGSTAALGVTVRGLEREDDYTFEVAQTNALGVSGPAVAREFELDVTPPEPVNVWGRPAPGPGRVPNPTFSWTEGESDSRYLWQVTGAGGAAVQGPAIVAATQVATAPLRAGKYVFTVAHLDPAGNASVENQPVPFEIQQPPAPRPRAARAKPGQRASRFAPRTVRTSHLSPDLGDRVRLARPRLAWRSACRGSFFNVQIVRMNGRKVVRVHSGFTRLSRYRVPAGVLKPGNRYYWQVWCWMKDARRYASGPVGVSSFTQLPPRKPKRLLAPAGEGAIAGEALAVRWRAAPRTGYYGVRVRLGDRTVFQGRTKGRKLSVPGARLAAPGRYRIIVLRGLGGPKKTRYAPAAWAGTAVELVAG